MQNIAIDGKFKIINPIYDSKNFVEEPLEIRPQKPATINLIFQKNQLILHQLTLKMKILIMVVIGKSIKVLPMNILIPLIQIKLHLIAILL